MTSNEKSSPPVALKASKILSNKKLTAAEKSVAADDKETLIDNWLRKARNQPAIAGVIAISLLLGGAASFGESFSKLWNALHSLSENRKNESDVLLEKSIIGSWKAGGVLPDGSTFEQITAYNRDGKMSVLSNISNNGKIITFLGSGRWSIKDGVLNDVVESSSRPDMVAVGFSEFYKIISITDSEFVYVNTFNGTKIVESRVK